MTSRPDTQSLREKQPRDGQIEKQVVLLSA